jgi:hypothetical protein
MYNLDTTKYMLQRIRLWNAAMNGDVGELLHQIDRFQRDGGASSLKMFVNSRNDANGHTALISACIGGHLSIIKYLIYYGGNIYYQDKRRMTPLHHLAIHGHGSCIKFILLICKSRDRQNELVRLKDQRGLTALDLAEVAQRDWVYARERVNTIGSFIDKQQQQREQHAQVGVVGSSKMYVNESDFLHPSDVEKENEFQWATQLLSNPPQPMRKSIFQTLIDEEQETKKQQQQQQQQQQQHGNGNKKIHLKNVLSINSFRGPLAYFPINHQLFTLALPNKYHQSKLANAARHCPSLKRRMENATTMKEISLIVNVMKPALGIEYSVFDKKVHRKKLLEKLSLNEMKRKEKELKNQQDECEQMFSEDANALKIRKYLTCDHSKLLYIKSIFHKLCRANNGLDTLDSSKNDEEEEKEKNQATTRVDELTPLFFTKFIAATGELVNSEQTRVILKTIRDLTSKEHGIWPPQAIGDVEFTIFWLLGEEAANKEAMKPLPHWMRYDNTNTSNPTDADLSMKESAKAALPKPTWLKRLKARILINSKVNNVTQSASRTSIFARIMNRAAISFDEVDHVNSDLNTPAVLSNRVSNLHEKQKRSIISRFMHLSRMLHFYPPWHMIYVTTFNILQF